MLFYVIIKEGRKMIKMNFKNYVILGKKELNKELFNPVKNITCSVKPQGGLWACPYYPNHKYISGWHKWCSSEMDNWLSNDSIILELKDDARIFTIDKEKDLIDFINIVGIAEDEFTLRMGLKMLAYPNFKKASQLFDVIYLTKKGQWKTRFTSNECDYNLYGWDCESILILNFNCIDKWEYKKLDIVKERL
jgi:hypothetical protein